MLCKVFKSSSGKVQPILSWACMQLAEVHSLVGPSISILCFAIPYYLKSSSDPNRECRKLSVEN